MDMPENIEDSVSEGEWLTISPCLVAREYPVGLPEQRLRLWALVLDARSVPCRIEQGDSGQHLLVPVEWLSVACRELRLFEEENRNWPPPVPRTRPMVENTLATLSVLLLLGIFHNLIQFGLTLPDGYTPDWIALGSAQATEIRNGQWWRLVTALTLHADWVHLSGNLCIGGIFVIFLCSELGSGLAWSLLLGSGVLGNLANAWVQSPDHSSVGASTAVFGTVGILAAISLVRYRRQRQRRWVLPVAAALALLALLGTEGKNTDLGAHLFGFIFGVGLGMATEYLQEQFGRPGRLLNAVLALASAGVVVAAWWAAVASGG
jgi:membrane associated rhomboid family serine protease